MQGGEMQGQCVAIGSALLLGDVTIEPVAGAAGHAVACNHASDAIPMPHAMHRCTLINENSANSARKAGRQAHIQLFSAIRDGNVERVRVLVQGVSTNPSTLVVWRAPARAVLLSALELAVLTLNQAMVLVLIDAGARPQGGNVFDGRVRLHDGTARVVHGYERIPRGGCFEGYQGLRMILGAWRDGQDLTVAMLSPRSRKVNMQRLLAKLEQLASIAWPPPQRFWVELGADAARRIRSTLQTTILCTWRALQYCGAVSMVQHIVDSIASQTLAGALRIGLDL